MSVCRENKEKHLFGSNFTTIHTCTNASFSETDYDTLLFSVKYEGTFTIKHDDVQHIHQEGALDMPVLYTKFPEQQAGHCDDVNKCHYTLSNSNVLKGS